jgi:predicted flap endonuclease-1-like 5' DNA nuclease
MKSKDSDAILILKGVNMFTLAEIEGIGPANAAKLNKAGVRGTNGLLQMGGSKKGRQELSKATGFSPKTILGWVNRADLFRVKGIGAQYSDLLEAAGVDTVVELSKRKPETLLESMTKVNAKKNLVNQLPALNIVRDWVKNAKSLKRAVEY